MAIWHMRPTLHRITRIPRVLLLAGTLLIPALAAVSMTAMTPSTADSNVAKVDLREPVALEDLAALERDLGVQVIQFHHRHRGAGSTMTAGGVIRLGESVAAAVARHERSQAVWFPARIAHLSQLAEGESGAKREMIERTLADILRASVEIQQNGIRVDRLIVRANSPVIEGLRLDPRVLSVSR